MQGLIIALASLCGFLVQLFLLQPSSDDASLLKASCPALGHDLSGSSNALVVVAGQCKDATEERLVRELLLGGGVSKIYLACPTLQRAQSLAKEHRVVVVPQKVDFGSLTSVANFAQVLLLNEKRRVDVVLVHSNFAEEFILVDRTENGLEKRVAINHIGPAFLFRLLTPRRAIHWVLGGSQAKAELDVENWVEDGAAPNVFLPQVLFMQELSKRSMVQSGNIVVGGRARAAATAVYLALTRSPLAMSVLGEDCTVFPGLRREFFEAALQRHVWTATEFAADPRTVLFGDAGAAAAPPRWEEYAAPSWSSYQASYEFQSGVAALHEARERAFAASSSSLQQEPVVEEEGGKEAALKELRKEMEEECATALAAQMKESAEYYKQTELALRLDFETRVDNAERLLQACRAAEAANATTENAQLRDLVTQLKHELNATRQALESTSALPPQQEECIGNAPAVSQDELAQIQQELGRKIDHLTQASLAQALVLVQTRHALEKREAELAEMKTLTRQSDDEALLQQKIEALRSELNKSRMACLFRNAVRIMKQRQEFDAQIASLKSEQKRTLDAELARRAQVEQDARDQLALVQAEVVRLGK